MLQSQDSPSPSPIQHQHSSPLRTVPCVTAANLTERVSEIGALEFLQVRVLVQMPDDLNVLTKYISRRSP